MFLSDMNVPLLLSAMAFFVMCLLGIGIQIYIRGLRYRRAMIEKIGTADDEWAVIGKDAQPSDLVRRRRFRECPRKIPECRRGQNQSGQIDRRCRYQTQVFEGRTAE